jgi:hypothetical protein
LPVPHFNIKITQRSKGNSAVAGAAYQAGEKLFSEYDQKTKNYTCKKEVVCGEYLTSFRRLIYCRKAKKGDL